MEWSKIKEGIWHLKFLRLRMVLFWSSVILLVFFAINGVVEWLLSSILFLYCVLISFYFGSRSVEMKDRNELIKKGDVGKILEISYAVWDISKKEYDLKKDELGLK